MFSNFYQVDLHNKICVALATLRWSTDKIWLKNQTSPDVVVVMEGACLLALSPLGQSLCEGLFTGQSP